MTDEEILAFLESYQQHGVIATACHAAKISFTTYRKELDVNPDFKQDCEDAYQFAVSVAEMELRRRAVHGVEEPVVFHGELMYMRDPATGEYMLDDNFEKIPFTINKKSDKLLETYMKANSRKYGVSGRGNGLHAADGEGGGNRLPSKLEIVLVQSDGNGGKLEDRGANAMVIEAREVEEKEPVPRG